MIGDAKDRGVRADFCIFFYPEVRSFLKFRELTDILECSPVIAAIHECDFDDALQSPCEVLFHLQANILSVAQRVEAAHNAGKKLFIHIDLATGIGKDKAGVEFLARCGTDGIISTRGQLIRYGKECGLMTVQRFFALDSRGIDSIHELLDSTAPDLIELMPGVIGKIIRRFSGGSIPVIAGGLLETKAEVTEAISCGATAVSTSAKALWYI